MSHYIIDKSKWVCGDNSEKMGDTAMLNDKGRMCCLGQMCKQAGVSKKSLKFNSSPDEIDHKKVPKWMLTKDSVGLKQDSELSQILITVNDDYSISQKKREREITKLLKEAGHTVEFKGKLFPKKKKSE